MSVYKKVVLFVCFILALILIGCSKEETVDGNIIIDTKYTELVFPKKYVDDVNIIVSENDPYTVSFYAETETKELILFEIIFNGNKGSEIGFIEAAKDIYVMVSVEKYALPKEMNLSDSEKKYFEEIQSGLIYLIDNLKIVENDIALSKKTIIIDTPIVEIKIPENWRNYIDIEINQNLVRIFYVNDYDVAIEVFSICFGEKNENTVGVLTNAQKEDIYVNIEITDIETTLLSEEESKVINAIAEDINIILDHLQFDYGFVYLNNHFRT